MPRSFPSPGGSAGNASASPRGGLCRPHPEECGREASKRLYTLRRIAYRAYELRHPEEPWIAQGGDSRFCERWLKGDMKAVETGSGRSTAWFAGRVGHLTSVEHHQGWYDKVRGNSKVCRTSTTASSR
jgi:hypothetical protein